MQRKIIIDTNVYIDIFNNNLNIKIINPFQNITYLAWPVLHELWMGLKNHREVRALTQWRDRFIQLKRLVIPTASTIVAIGDCCLALRKTGKLDPAHPKHYNDICIAAIANQIGAVVITNNQKDFKLIQKVIDFEFQFFNLSQNSN